MKSPAPHFVVYLLFTSLYSYTFAAPTSITYQGSLKQSGVPVNATVTMSFSITNSACVPYWSSGNQSVSVKEGLYRVELTPTNVDWANVDPYIQVSVNNAALTPCEKIGATPYAIFAGNLAIGATAQSLLTINGDGAKMQMVRPSNGRVGYVGLNNSYGSVEIHGGINGSLEATVPAVYFTGDSPVPGSIYGTIKPSGCAFQGTNTNDNAPTGFVGEYISSSVGPQNISASDTYFTPISITLSPGDWDVSALGQLIRNGATFSALYCNVIISKIPGNGMPTDRVYGQNSLEANFGGSSLSFYSLPLAIPVYRVSVNVPQTLYFKLVVGTYSSGAPQFYARISARRVR